jgi:1-acyl-sn-glycerol-3-phosphate acyltransferase
MHWFVCFWSWVLIKTNPFWSVKITGKLHTQNKKPVIIICNHQSLLDILVLNTLFIHFKWVSKTELFSLPFVGWLMALSGYIRIKRGKMESIKKMMLDCSKAIQKGNSVLIFPEGTRSVDGTLGRFREGAFRLALKNQVSILPVKLTGTAEALPKNSIMMKKKQLITVSVMPVCNYENFRELSSDQLKEKMRIIYTR